MVRAAEHGGTLPTILQTLADRHERSGQFTHRLLGALAYPTVVSVLGLGVVVFLSTTTLPELVRILTDAGVEAPTLTLRVLAGGQLLAGSWGWLLLGLLAFVVLVQVSVRRLGTRDGRFARVVDRLRPAFLRQKRVGSLATGLSELLSTGVPLAEALSVLEPTTGPRLSKTLREAKARIERGEPLAKAFADPVWFRRGVPAAAGARPRDRRATRALFARRRSLRTLGRARARPHGVDARAAGHPRAGRARRHDRACRRPSPVSTSRGASMNVPFHVPYLLAADPTVTAPRSRAASPCLGTLGFTLVRNAGRAGDPRAARGRAARELLGRGRSGQAGARQDRHRRHRPEGRDVPRPERRLAAERGRAPPRFRMAMPSRRPPSTSRPISSSTRGSGPFCVRRAGTGRAPVRDREPRR